MAQITIYAVVTKDNSVVGAYTNILSASRRVEYLDSKEDFELNPNMPGKRLAAIKEYHGSLRLGPYKLVKCIGEI